jgi:hypothetical protein
LRVVHYFAEKAAPEAVPRESNEQCSIAYFQCGIIKSQKEGEM